MYYDTLELELLVIKAWQKSDRGTDTTQILVTYHPTYGMLNFSTILKEIKYKTFTYIHSEGCVIY